MTASPSLLGDGDRAALAERFADRVRFDEPLAPATWWNVGGPADAMATARATGDVAFALEWCR